MIETTLKIDGMMCGMCEAHVSDVIRSKFNIKKCPLPTARGRRLSCPMARWVRPPCAKPSVIPATP